jgi:hypothetical protein
VILWCGMVRCGTVWCGVVQYGAVRCEPVKEIQNQEYEAQRKKETYGRGVVLSPGMPGR